MADASHELRPPVAILRGEAEVALSRQARSPEEYREWLGVLHQEAERLAHIVDDLFTLTRADAGQYPLQPRDFYLDELVGECVHSARTLALAKKISLNFEEASESPIHADESLLRRMILNLLDNAIKYTSEGGRVTLTCRRSGDEYALSITDTGGGIPADLQPSICERFFQADNARPRAGKGRSETKRGGVRAQQGRPATRRRTLENALARARKNSTPFQAALTDAGLARGDKSLARDALLPNVNYNAQYLYTQGNGPGELVRFIANNAVHEYISQGNVHQILDLARISNYRRVSAAAAAARARAEVASRGLVVTVVRSYYAVAAAQQNLLSAQRPLYQPNHLSKLTQDL